MGKISYKNTTRSHVAATKLHLSNENFLHKIMFVIVQLSYFANSVQYFIIKNDFNIN